MKVSDYDVIEDFGAVGDGVTDDAPAIQRGINKATDIVESAACASHRVFGSTIIRFPTPKKFYRLKQGLVIRNGHPVTLVGTSPGAVVLALQPDKPIPVIHFVPPLFVPPLPLSLTRNAAGMLVLQQQWTQYLAYVRARYAVYFAKLLFDDVLAPYLLSGPTSQMVNALERITLVGGGVLVGGPTNTRSTAIRDCTIRCAPKSAITLEDQTVTTVDISRCVIEDCNHGVNIAFSQCDFWTLSQCRFARNSGIDLILGSSGCHVYDTVFAEKRPTSNGDRLPYVHVKEGPGEEDAVPVRYKDTGAFGKAIEGGSGNNRFVDCLFGDVAKPPKDLIVVGPIGADGTYAKTNYENAAAIGPKNLYVADVQFDGCVFGGSTYLQEDRPRSVLRLTAPCQGLRVVGCSAWACETLVLEDAITYALKANDFAVSSRCFANTIELLNTRGRVDRLFSAGGCGFELVGQAARDLGYPESVPVRPGTNLLRGADATWQGLISSPPGKALSFLTPKEILPPTWPVGIEAPGPFAWELVPTAKVDEYQVLQRLDDETTKQIVEAAKVGGAVFSVWLKAGTLERAAIEIVWNGFILGGGTGVSDDYPITLASNWERHEVVAERIPSVEEIGATWGPSVRIRVRNHLKDDLSLKLPAFSLAMPQFELGRSASPFSPARQVDAHRGPRPFQFEAFGGHVIEYGSTPPAEGWHDVGDLVIDTHPVAGGWRGWICSQAGVNPTWRHFGKIEK